MSQPGIKPPKTVNYTPPPSMQECVKDLETRVSTDTHFFWNLRLRNSKRYLASFNPQTVSKKQGNNHN